MIEKLLGIILDFESKFGSVYIDGIDAYLIDCEGFYGPQWLRMGYLAFLEEFSYRNISKFENKIGRN